MNTSYNYFNCFSFFFEKRIIFRENLENSHPENILKIEAEKKADNIRENEIDKDTLWTHFKDLRDNGEVEIFEEGAQETLKQLKNDLNYSSKFPADMTLKAFINNYLNLKATYRRMKENAQKKKYGEKNAGEYSKNSLDVNEIKQMTTEQMIAELNEYKNNPARIKTADNRLVAIVQRIVSGYFGKNHDYSKGDVVINGKWGAKEKNALLDMQEIEFSYEINSKGGNEKIIRNLNKDSLNRIIAVLKERLEEEKKREEFVQRLNEKCTREVDDKFAELRVVRDGTRLKIPADVKLISLDYSQSVDNEVNLNLFTNDNYEDIDFNINSEGKLFITTYFAGGRTGGKWCLEKLQIPKYEFDYDRLKKNSEAKQEGSLEENELKGLSENEKKLAMAFKREYQGEVKAKLNEIGIKDEDINISGARIHIPREAEVIAYNSKQVANHAYINLADIHYDDLFMEVKDGKVFIVATASGSRPRKFCIQKLEKPKLPNGLNTTVKKENMVSPKNSPSKVEIPAKEEVKKSLENPPQKIAEKADQQNDSKVVHPLSPVNPEISLENKNTDTLNINTIMKEHRQDIIDYFKNVDNFINFWQENFDDLQSLEGNRIGKGELSDIIRKGMPMIANANFEPQGGKSINLVTYLLTEKTVLNAFRNFLSPSEIESIFTVLTNGAHTEIFQGIVGITMRNQTKSSNKKFTDYMIAKISGKKLEKEKDIPQDHLEEQKNEPKKPESLKTEAPKKTATSKEQKPIPEKKENNSNANQETIDSIQALKDKGGKITEFAKLKYLPENADKCVDCTVNLNNQTMSMGKNKYKIDLGFGMSMDLIDINKLNIDKGIITGTVWINGIVGMDFDNFKGILKRMYNGDKKIDLPYGTSLKKV